MSLALSTTLSAAAQDRAGRDELPVAQPVWTWAIGGSIEWTAAAGTQSDAPVLVVNADGELFALDLIDGSPALAHALHVGRGARLGPGATPIEQDGELAGEVIYIADRWQVHALEVCAGKVGLRWIAGERPERRAGLPGYQRDPEFLPEIVALNATDAGVLVVRNDGQVMLLAGEDGQVLNACRISATRQAEMHVRARVGYLVSRENGAVGVWPIALDAGVVLPAPIAWLGDSWPHFVELTTCGLVVAHDSALLMAQPETIVCRAAFEQDDCLQSPRFTVCDAAGTTKSGEAASSSAPVVLVRAGECGAVGHNAADGGILWRREYGERRAARGGTGPYPGSRDGVLWMVTDSSSAFHDARTGELLVSIETTARIVDTFVNGPWMYTLSVEIDDGRQWVVLRIGGSAGSVPDGWAVVLRGAPTASGAIVDCAWRPPRVIVASRSELRAYVLP